MATAGFSGSRGLISMPVVCVASRATLPPTNETPFVPGNWSWNPAATCPGAVTVRSPVTEYAAPVGAAEAGGVAVNDRLNGALGVPAGAPGGLVQVMPPVEVPAEAESTESASS